MNKYIKAQDLIDRIYPVDPENDGSDGCTVVYQNLTLSSPEIEAIVEELPAADVAPVVHGRWENKKGSPVSCYWTKDMKYLMVQEEAHCSVCGEYLNASAEYTVEGTFCPHCGAKMDQRG